MKGIVLFIFIFPATAFASGPIKTVNLTPTTAKSLGFEVVVESDKGSTMVTLKGPSQNANSCPATKSGSYVLDAKGNEVSGNINFISNPHPFVFGYYTKSEYSMGVFIDYICTDLPHLKSERYTIDSISSWLITNQ